MAIQISPIILCMLLLRVYKENEIIMPLAVEKFVGEDLRTDSTLSFGF